MSVVRSTVRPPLRRSPHGWHQSTESRAIHRLISHGNSLRLPQCYSLSQNSPRDRCNAASSAIPLPLTQPAGAGDSGCAPCRARSPQLFLRRERCRGAFRGYSPARLPPQQQQQQQWGRQPEDAGQPQRRWAAHASSRPSCIYTRILSRVRTLCAESRHRYQVSVHTWAHGDAPDTAEFQDLSQSRLGAHPKRRN